MLKRLAKAVDELEPSALAGEIDAERWVRAQNDLARELYRQRMEIIAALELPSEVVALRELVAALWLDLRRHAEAQLTTEQKELLYDTVEQEAKRRGDFAGPLERWWRAQ